MAPIEPDLSNSNIRPLALFSSYIALASGLTAFVSRYVLFGAYKQLPPSQATRLRASNRQKHIVVFILLSIASLAIAWWHLFAFFSLSYRHWAYEMGQPVPEHVYGERGIWGPGSTGLALGRWLNDTELFRDAWEIVIERSRRYWWSQQILLGAIAWSVFVGIEGRRRNIRHLWAFMLLGETVSLAFAVNVFFIAILLTAVPLAPRQEGGIQVEQNHVKFKGTQNALVDQLRRFQAQARKFFPPLPSQPHHQSWTPYPLAYFAPLLVAFVCAFFLPWSTNDPLFMPLLLIIHLALFQPLYPQYLMPEVFGSRTHRHDWRILSTLIGVFSFILHANQTLVALFDSDPGAYAHRHSHYLAYAHLPHESEHTRTYRSASAVSRVLGALNDHPAVSSVGWDVLMTGVSLGVWAAVRGIDPRRTLAAIGFREVPTPSASAVKPTISKQRKRSASKAAKDQTAETEPSPVKSPAKSIRRRKKSVTTDLDDPFVDTAAKDNTADKDFKTNSEQDHEMALGCEEELPENFESAAVSWGLLALGGLGLCAAGVLHA